MSEEVTPTNIFTDDGTPQENLWAKKVTNNAILKDIFKNPFALTDEDRSYLESSAVVERQPETSRRELWSYYLYYNGDNGFTMFSYLPNILQTTAYEAGVWSNNSTLGNCLVKNNDTNAVCLIPWAGGQIPVASMVLYVQAISFALQFVLFLCFGGLADYGKWNKYILLTATVLGCVAQFIPAFLTQGSQWNAMMAMMILSWIGYGASLVFYAAAFPPIADNLPAVRAARANPKLSAQEKAAVKEKWLNHVSAISTTYSNVGFLIVTGILAIVAFAAHAYVDGAWTYFGAAPLFNNVGAGFCAVFWAINAVWYFIFIPRGRGGPPLPPNSNYITVGPKSVLRALREIRKLKMAFIYIIAYFMFADGVNTMNTMAGVVQGQITSFNGGIVTVLNLVSAITSILGCMTFLYLQKAFKWSTKTTLLIIIGGTALVPLWGTVGIGATTFGIHTVAELWVFYVWTGLITAPIYAWQQTMLAELIPKGKEGLFFGLFGIVNRASSWVGPVIIGAITQVTQNLWDGWPLVLALFVIPMIIIYSIDVDRARRDVVEYMRLEAEAEGRDMGERYPEFDANSVGLNEAALGKEEKV